MTTTVQRRSSTLGLCILFLCSFAVCGASASPLDDAQRVIQQMSPSLPPAFSQRGAPDTDLDGIVDPEDNCLTVSNADQNDSNGDGLGNACDADLNQDCVVNVIDLGLLRSVFFTSDADADLNSDGVVNVIDLGLMRAAFFATPGPSAVTNDCGVALTISGSIVGATLPGAVVTGRVEGQDYMADLLFTAPTAPDGSFSLVIFAPTGDDFVTLSTDGIDTQSFIRFESAAGTADRLAAAGNNDGTVNSDEANTVDLSALSSALTVLAREKNGGTLISDADFDRAVARVDSALMTDLAVLTTLYIDLPIARPDFALNSMALIADPVIREPVFDLLANAVFPVSEDLAASLATVLTRPYTNETVPATLNLMVSDNLQKFTAQTVSLAPDGTATFASNEASTTGQWSLDADGSIAVVFDTPGFVREFMTTVEDPANPGSFIVTLAVIVSDQLTLRRVVDGEIADHVYSTVTTRTTYPDAPGVPEPVAVELAGRATAYLAYDRSLPFPLNASDLGGQNFVGAFYHRDNAAEGSGDPRRGADTLEFNADGTGQTRRRGFAFTWSVDPQNGLQLEFDNGDTNRFDFFFDDDNDQLVTIVSATLVNDSQFVARSRLLPRACDTGCDRVAFDNARWRSRLTTQTTAERPLTVFDFMLRDNLTACRNPGSASSSWGWAFLDGRVELNRVFENTPDFFFYRTWEPLVETSDGFYVIETLQVADNVPQVDAAVTPGRLNFYAREQDLVNNQRPTLGDDEATVQTGVGVIFYFTLLTLNDIDPEGDEVFVRDVDFTSANGGTLTAIISPLSNQWIGMRYQPPQGFVGVDTFEYRASDLFCYDEPVTSATVSITLLP